MRWCKGSLAWVAAVAFAPFLCSAEPESAASDAPLYEELPVLKASEILRPDIQAGPYHKVREEVPTRSGANRFTIDSDFGVFVAEGNEMLLKRVQEINAIARLREISRTDEFKDALKEAAKGPYRTAKALVADPVETLSAIPQGLKKFVGRAGDTVKGIGKKKESDDPKGKKMQDIIGFTDKKRKLAISLGVDPYSSNDVLQHELDEIAWASFAGGATFTVGTLPIGGGVGVALTATQVTGSFQDMLRDKKPADLKAMNRKFLLEMGASESDTTKFLGNGAFSPSAQTAFVLNLRELKGVSNRGSFVGIAGRTSASEPDAIFCVQTAALMARLHQGEKPLAQLTKLGDFPIGIAQDGSAVIALQWDYAAYTPMADNFARELEKVTGSKGPRLVALSGIISPRLREELEKRGNKVQDRLAPGPLK